MCYAIPGLHRAKLIYPRHCLECRAFFGCLHCMLYSSSVTMCTVFSLNNGHFNCPDTSNMNFRQGCIEPPKAARGHATSRSTARVQHSAECYKK